MGKEMDNFSLIVDSVSSCVEEQSKTAKAYRDKVRGCIFGGAVGDALGYPVEFMNEAQIYSRSPATAPRGRTGTAPAIRRSTGG